MSQFKIYKLNNYLIVECDDPVYEKQVMAADVRILPTPEDPLVFDFFNFDNENTKWNTIRLSDMVDEGDTPYTLETWTEFYTSNTGFNPAGGGSSAVFTFGSIELVGGSGENAFPIPHGLGSVPSSYLIHFTDRNNTEYFNSTDMADANELVIVTLASTITSTTVNWVAFK